MDVLQISQNITNRCIHLVNSHRSISSRLSSVLSTVKSYQNPELQELALKEIPVEKLHEIANSKLNSSTTFQIELLKALLHWFKAEYFSWVNELKCEVCGSDTTRVPVTPTNTDLQYGASRVEGFQCKVCNAVTRFPRYNDCRMLVKTRRGRCGEWANCFTLFCIAMGYDARYVLDFTDHVWTEAFINGKWIHLDSCEEVLVEIDSRLMTSRWFTSKDGYTVTDTHKRYSRSSSVAARRRQEIVSESWLKQCIDDINYRSTLNLSQTLKEQIKKGRDIEQEQLDKLALEKPSASSAELDGRISGSLEWRSLRGETGHTAYTWSKKSSLALDINQAQLNRDAKMENGRVVLTPNAKDCVGSVFWKHQIKCRSFNEFYLGDIGFGVDFSFKITGAGADGLALCFQTQDLHAIGRGGSGLGYDDIPNSIALEVDTYHTGELDDPNPNHISLNVNGAHHNKSVGIASTLPPLSDGREYCLRFVCKWDGSVLVYLNDSSWDLLFTAKLDEGFWKQQVFVGFTGATGGLHQKHEVWDVSLFSLAP